MGAYLVLGRNFGPARPDLRSGGVVDQSLTEVDNGRTVEVRLRESLKILLRESRTGGYRWNLVETGEPMLTPAEVGTKATPSLPGQKHLRCWEFTAQQPGSARIQIRHRRPWEPESSGSEFSLNVNVVA
jgi:predicted secreted protein